MWGRGGVVWLCVHLWMNSPMHEEEEEEEEREAEEEEEEEEGG